MMTLEEAIDRISARATVKIDLDAKYGFIVCSGGRLIDGDMPALYLNESLAVAAWLEAVEKELGPALPQKNLTWVDSPKIEWFQVTIADRRNTHRIVADHCTVRSKLVIDEAPGVVAVAVAEPEPPKSAKKAGAK
ncbi:MAG: hypothetical protein WDN46_10315 [Methylocella sp.]